MRGTHALTLQHLMSSFGGPQTVEGRKAPRQRPAESYLKYVAGRADGGQRSRWAVIRDPQRFLLPYFLLELMQEIKRF
jgi:hypothetical protein